MDEVRIGRIASEIVPRRFARVACLLVVLSASVASAQARPTSEARSRFERGLQFFDAGDNDRAIAEFQRAYELSPRMAVLYNIGLVQAARGRPVEAVDSLTQVLDAKTGVSPEELAHARRTLETEQKKIAELVVTCNVPGASIAVDSVQVAKTPRDTPLRIASGTRVISVEAPGYLPLRREVTLAGGVKLPLDFQLAVTEGRLAHLQVKTQLLDSDVLVDGQKVATTPVASTLTLAPGTLKVEVRRGGYESFTKQLVLGDGAAGELVGEPAVDEAALTQHGGTVRVRASESRVRLEVDGEGIGDVGAPVRVPVGRHRVRALRAGFELVERTVSVADGATASLELKLVPTSAYRESFVSSAKTRRTAGIITFGAGLAVAVVGGVVSGANEAHIQSLKDETAAGVAASAGGAGCEPDVCAHYKNVDARRVNAENLRGLTYGVLGAGVVAAGIGLVLWLTAPNAHRYDLPTGAPRAAFGVQGATLRF